MLFFMIHFVIGTNTEYDWNDPNPIGYVTASVRKSDIRIIIYGKDCNNFP